MSMGYNIVCSISNKKDGHTGLERHEVRFVVICELSL